MSAGYKVWRNLALGVGYSWTDSKSPASITASIPDPRFFDRPRSATATTPDLKHSENVINLMAVWMMPITDKIDVGVSAGPSIFNVKQEPAERADRVGTGRVDRRRRGDEGEKERRRRHVGWMSPTCSTSATASAASRATSGARSSSRARPRADRRRFQIGGRRPVALLNSAHPTGSITACKRQGPPADLRSRPCGFVRVRDAQLLDLATSMRMFGTRFGPFQEGADRIPRPPDVH